MAHYSTKFRRDSIFQDKGNLALRNTANPQKIRKVYHGSHRFNLKSEPQSFYNFLN